jgi:cytochrome c-type biogenesis protein CcmH
MSGFFAGAAVLALIAVLFVALPLVRVRTAPPAATAAIVAALALIAFSVLTYRWLGNPAAIRLSEANARTAADSIAQLARHVEHDPQDFEGWLKLAGAYELNNRFPLALNAYQRADTLAGGQSPVALAGMGESLLAIQGAAQGPDVTRAAEYFERALALDPKSPKALYYSALLAMQSGHLELARARFTTMLAIQPAPPANVLAALRQEIAAIDAQLHPPVDAATAIRLHVSLAPNLAKQVPSNASLFVFVQAPDGGAPLAVHRGTASLPQDLVLSSDDAMIAARAVKPGQKVTVVARISASGNPLPQKGDLYGQIEYVAGKTGPRPLEIDKLTP